MKKYLTLIILGLLLFASPIFAYSPQTRQFIVVFEEYIQPMNASEKNEYFKKFSNLLESPSIANHPDKKVQIFLSELDTWIHQQRKLLDPAHRFWEKKHPSSYQDLPNVDFEKVRAAWLQWHNEAREKWWLSSLSYHMSLEKTAKNWADYQVEIQQATHRRTPSDPYYDYQKIKNWFADLEVTFAPETGWRSAFSESIGYRNYRCSAWDCTQNVIDVTKKVFNAFLAEGENWSHYRSIMMPHFKSIGLGFQHDPQTNYLYVVIHYAGDIVEI